MTDTTSRQVYSEEIDAQADLRKLGDLILHYEVENGSMPEDWIDLLPRYLNRTNLSLLVGSSQKIEGTNYPKLLNEDMRFELLGQRGDDIDIIVHENLKGWSNRYSPNSCIAVLRRD
jgi:hypothetical protein